MLRYVDSYWQRLPWFQDEEERGPGKSWSWKRTLQLVVDDAEVAAGHVPLDDVQTFAVVVVVEVAVDTVLVAGVVALLPRREPWTALDWKAVAVAEVVESDRQHRRRRSVQSVLSMPRSEQQGPLQPLAMFPASADGCCRCCRCFRHLNSVDVANGDRMDDDTSKKVHR